MQNVHGMVEGQPGMFDSETYIEEDVKYKEGCPCRTRTCPQHGFCRECVLHHKEVSAHLAEMGLPPESVMCQRLQGR